MVRRVADEDEVAAASRGQRDRLGQRLQPGGGRPAHRKPRRRPARSRSGPSSRSRPPRATRRPTCTAIRAARSPPRSRQRCRRRRPGRRDGRGRARARAADSRGPLEHAPCATTGASTTRASAAGWSTGSLTVALAYIGRPRAPSLVRNATSSAPPTAAACSAAAAREDIELGARETRRQRPPRPLVVSRQEIAGAVAQHRGSGERRAIGRAGRALARERSP